MLEIIRVSIVPFDLLCGLGEPQRAQMANRGFQELDQLPWIERLLGERPTAFEVDKDHTIVASPGGFCLNLRRHRETVSGLSDHGAVARLVVERDRHHRRVRSGVHDDVVLIRDLKQDLSSIASQNARRPDIWDCPPYTLSFFYVRATSSEVLDCHDAKRGLSALLEPSQVRRLDLADHPTEVDACAELIGALTIERLQEKYRDSDVKAGSTALCSWAGMVAFDQHGADLPYYESLEIRLQMAWLKASLVRRWAEQALVQDSLEPEKLARLAVEVSPILRQTRRLIDATASTRDQELFDELVETSDLNREIDGAEEALADVRTQIELAQSVVRKRYDRTIEALLLFLAVMQVVPLVMTAPVVHLSPRWLVPTALALLAFAIVRSRKT